MTIKDIYADYVCDMARSMLCDTVKVWEELEEVLLKYGYL